MEPPDCALIVHDEASLLSALHMKSVLFPDDIVNTAKLELVVMLKDDELLFTMVTMNPVVIPPIVASGNLTVCVDAPVNSVMG
jgi:hypothetical protein